MIVVTPCVTPPHPHCAPGLQWWQFEVTTISGRQTTRGFASGTKREVEQRAKQALAQLHQIEGVRAHRSAWPSKRSKTRTGARQ